MKKTLAGIGILLVVIVLCANGIIEPITRFFVWLVTINMSQSNISIVGDIFVRIASFLISYALVGAIFNAIGCFDGGVMKLAYFVISNLVSLGLCYIVMLVEAHSLLVIIIGAILLVGSIIALIGTWIKYEGYDSF